MYHTTHSFTYTTKHFVSPRWIFFSCRTFLSLCLTFLFYTGHCRGPLNVQSAVAVSYVCVCIQLITSTFSTLHFYFLFLFLFFGFHAFLEYCGYCLLNSNHKCWLSTVNSIHVYCLWTHKFHFLSIFSLKMGPTVLFTHLKIILLQYFQFSVFSFNKISSIQTHHSWLTPNDFNSSDFRLVYTWYPLANGYCF